MISLYCSRGLHFDKTVPTIIHLHSCSFANISVKQLENCEGLCIAVTYYLGAPYASIRNALKHERERLIHCVDFNNIMCYQSSYYFTTFPLLCLSFLARGAEEWRYVLQFYSSNLSLIYPRYNLILEFRLRESLMCWKNNRSVIMVYG